MWPGTTTDMNSISIRFVSSASPMPDWHRALCQRWIEPPRKSPLLGVRRSRTTFARCTCHHHARAGSKLKAGFASAIIGEIIADDLRIVPISSGSEERILDGDLVASEVTNVEPNTKQGRRIYGEYIVAVGSVHQQVTADCSDHQ